jgi:hemolysin-activating ACP:hemolysin acyltransferase
MAWAWGKTASADQAVQPPVGHPDLAAAAFEAQPLGAVPSLDTQSLPEHTPSPAASPEPQAEAATTTMSPEAIARATTMRRLAASFGDIVGLMMQTPQFKHQSLTDLEWLVMPALQTGQFMVMEVTDRNTGATGPIAAALWARVSEEVEARIIEAASAGRPMRLAPGDWVSGDRHWLVAAVGGQEGVGALMRQMKEGAFAETQLAVALDREKQIFHLAQIVDKSANSQSQSRAW